MLYFKDEIGKIYGLTETQLNLKKADWVEISETEMLELTSPELPIENQRQNKITELKFAFNESLNEPYSLNGKLYQLNSADLSISFGVTYTAQQSGVILVDLEWGNFGNFTKPGCEYMNAEIICSNGSNPQFCFACPYGWEKSGEAVSGSRPDMTLITLVESGDTYLLKGETKFGFDAASGMIVKSAKILY